MEKKGSCGGCASPAKDDLKKTHFETEEQGQKALARRMGKIRHKVLILSGKGGVGKSTVAVNLAFSLAASGMKVGLLDIDIHGPSVPRILGLEGALISGTEDVIFPTLYGENLKVMSIGFLLREQDDPVIWRGPLKYSAIKQFLTDVAWGELDYLVIDCPPGTGDEPLSIAQLIEKIDGALIVTTPQDVALGDVRKSVNFCRKLPVPLLGVIENMSGFVCPECGHRVDIFKSGGGENLAVEMGVPFLGSIPLDPKIVESCDDGEPFTCRHSGTATADSFEEITRAVLSLDRVKAGKGNVEDEASKSETRIAIPLDGEDLSPHFGHCREFALVDVDKKTRSIVHTEIVTAPEHQPGLLPSWLADREVKTVIAGGMGSRAQAMFAEKGIEVIVGAPMEKPGVIVRNYLDGNLRTGENVCDH